MKHHYILTTCLVWILCWYMPKLVMGMDTICLQLHWTTQAQFLGYYVAQEKGYYQAQGIHVIIQGEALTSPSTKQRHPVVRSLFLWDALKQEHQGKNLVNIAQLSQKSSLLFIAKKTKGYRSIHDFKGARVGIWKSPEGEVFKACLEREEIPVELIPFRQGTNLLIYDAVDVICATSYNERSDLEMSGFDSTRLDYFYLSHHDDWDFPEEGLYVDAQVYREQMDLFRRFVKATHQGWESGFQNTYEALKILAKRMYQNKIPFSFVAQRRMLMSIYKQYFNDQSNEVDFYLESAPFRRVALSMGIKPETARIYYQRMNQTP